MKFGLGLTGLAQQSPDADLAARFDDLLRTVRHVDDLGFDYLTIGQHFLTDPLQQLQSLPLLARLIPESTRLGLVSTLVVPLHNPVYLAESLTTLDVLSGGRIGVSFALGYRDVEYRAFGLATRERVRRFEAGVETILALWSGEPVTSHTPWWDLDDARIMTRPIQRPHPPVWIAANADAAVKRAARWGLPWNINSHATHATIRRQVRLYRETAAAAGHPSDLALPMSRELYCGATRREAFEEAGPYVAGKFDSYAQWGQHEVLPDKDDFRAPIHDLAADRFIIGSPEDCIEQLAAYRELGVDRVHLRMIWPGMPLGQALESMSRFAEEVMPTFQE